MPPLLAGVSARARLQFPIIQRAVREGLGTAQIQSLLQATALGGIRRTDLLSIVRGVRGIQTAGAQLRFLNRNTTPDPRRIPEALTKIRRAFSFTVRIRGVDVSTGESIERFVQVVLDNPVSRNTIEQLGFTFSQPEPDQYGFAVTEVLLTEGVKAGPLGTEF